MSEVAKWESILESLQAEICVINDKLDFYEEELVSLEQQLEEAEMMLGEARYNDRNEVGSDE